MCANKTEEKPSKEERSKARIQTAIDAVLSLIENCNIGEIVTKATFAESKYGRPLDNWSLSNQIMCLAAYLHKHPDTDVSTAIANMDFRGYRQWQAIKRQVLKGESSYACITAPMVGKRTDKKTGEEEMFIKGFMAVPVFGIEQTDGEPVEAGMAEREQAIRNFDFMDVAAKLGVLVKTAPGNKTYYGCYNPGRLVIELCTPDESTFYHELAHAVDDHLLKAKTGKGIKGGQQVDQEVVAQFSANVLAYIQGKEIEQTTAFTRQYLQKYIKGDLVHGVMELLSRIEAVVDYIVSNSEVKDCPASIGATA